MALPRGYISHSQIRAYKECPRKYRLAYIEGIQPPGDEKVFLGEIFHSAIEHYFRQRIGGVLPADEELEDYFRARFDTEASGRDISWRSPRDETRQRGLAFLRHFLRHVAPGMRPLMVEKELEAELPGSGALLKGVIDLVEEDFSITDFKTTTGRWSESRARNSPQMTIYKYLFDRSFGPLPASLKYEVFYGRTAGNVRHQTLRVIPDAGATEALLVMIDDVVQRIGAGVFPANETSFCRHCEFRAACRDMGPA